ncbi:hypothetical protein, unlikely [Trypanosoma brucei brucei TREU927]|uniref:Uncharacterized protein n=1 Tax=Trypanosoma brucei brucei (strain 927/4 GUTat10.1) TaxID=185431 RepID=Q38EW5_TRYB2|nr:hypothetical protein, unlikely [Trypanosoma brucei brucei TREU927]EAN76655.1 hypothetical protein, unlikely [Trypanosoma brucei brucei TREU927]
MYICMSVLIPFIFSLPFRSLDNQEKAGRKVKGRSRE